MTPRARSLSRVCLTLTAAALAACSDPSSPAPVASAPNLARAPEANGLPKLTSAALTTETTGSSLDASRFNITLRFVNPVTPTQRARFRQAAEKWQSIIVKDVSPVEGTIPADYCGLPGVPAFTGRIDDILIDVVLQPIDGPGAVLGAAGPCAVRDDDNLTAYGIMFFDTADLDFLESFGLLDETVTHEMGHVLGFGTLWNFNRSLLLGGGTADPRFVGPRARLYYRYAGGKTEVGVPVENIGGPGTADAHWRESVFDNELMTGFLNLGENPLSNVTAGAMADIGYTIVPNGDYYRLPGAPTARTQSRVALRGIDIASQERVFLPKGSIPKPH